MTTPFSPTAIGRLQVRNRIVMAPMTRSRAYQAGASPTDLTATYYAQRAGAGLIITEGTQPSPVGQGYINTPGLHSAEQVEAWRRVTEAVHAERLHGTGCPDADRDWSGRPGVLRSALPGQPRSSGASRARRTL